MAQEPGIGQLPSSLRDSALARFARASREDIAASFSRFSASYAFGLRPDRRRARPKPRPRIEITARPIAAFEPRDPARVQFGPLTFRGGMSLTSSYPEFGGISSIRVNADGARFLAVTDKGWWLRGRIVHEGTRPVGDRGCRDGAGARPRRQAARGARLVRHRIDGRGRRHRLSRHRARASHRAVRFRAAWLCWRAASRSRCRPAWPGCRATRASNASNS